MATMKAIAILVILSCAISTYANTNTREILKNKNLKNDIRGLLQRLKNKFGGSNVTQGSCSPNQFQCDNGECIVSYWECDDFDDCNDGSDEHAGCSGSGFGSCSQYQFRCDSGECINSDWECDNLEDCNDGSDEHVGCSGSSFGSCSPNQFQCDSGECIAWYWECDGVDDCTDGSDEHAGCSGSSFGSCSQNQFRCDGGECIVSYWECDDYDDCYDGSDEHAGCSESGSGSGSNFGSCSQNQFRCDSGECIVSYWECDDYDDCNDGSDEHAGCSESSSGSGSNFDICDGDGDDFVCDNGDPIPFCFQCDFFPDCLGGEDELICSHTCNNDTEFTCGDGWCIPREFRCDGWSDCFDGADEFECVPCKDYNPCVYGDCAQIEIDPKYECQCRSDEGEVKGYNCDFILQEASCKDDKCNFKTKMRIRQEVSLDPATRTEKKHAKNQLKKKQLGNGTCDDKYEFTCGNGDCIPSSWICDDYSDCNNGEDEVDCGSVAVHVSLQVKDDSETDAVVEIFPKRFIADAHFRLESNIPDVSRTDFKLDMGMSHFQAIFEVNIVERSKDLKSFVTVCFNLSLKEVLNLDFIPDEVFEFDGENGQGPGPVNPFAEQGDLEPCFLICNDNTIVSCDTTD